MKMNGKNLSWSCWVCESARVLSFHQTEGYQLRTFRCHSTFWLYIQAKISEGYLVM